MSTHATQLGFEALLQDADADNSARIFDRETAHLPTDWAEALAFHGTQITDHHAAMLAHHFDAAVAIRNEAHLLAAKLNGGRHGILADDNAPGCRLDVQARAPDGQVPLWGQSGRFDVNTAGLTARVEMDGMFRIGATAMIYCGFSVLAVHTDTPFLSATGYRSFLGASAPPETGMTTEEFVRRVIEAFVKIELRGRLLQIGESYRKPRAD